MFILLISAVLSSPPAAEKADDPQRLICKTQSVTGTRTLTKRTCLTAAQWRDQRGEAQKGLRDIVDRTMTSQVPPPDVPLPPQ